MPRIIIGVLIILLTMIVISHIVAKKKKGEALFTKPGRFFLQDADYFKLIGTLVLFAGYIFLLNIIGFTVTSIIFVFLLNTLYAGIEKKALLKSVIISIVAPLIVSIAFGVFFNITLPSGFLTMTFADFGFTIY
jgi:hypothetical protein